MGVKVVKFHLDKMAWHSPRKYKTSWTPICCPGRMFSIRNMFGAMVYMVGGKMFAFIHDDKLVVKLPQADKGTGY